MNPTMTALLAMIALGGKNRPKLSREQLREIRKSGNRTAAPHIQEALSQKAALKRIFRRERNKRNAL